MGSRYLSSLFKDISEDDLVYYAEERQKALSTRDLEKKYLTTDYSDAEVSDSRAELYIRYKNKDFSKFNLYGVTVIVNKNGDANFYIKDDIVTIKGYLNLEIN